MSYILAYLPYALITAFTPGPNNILVLNAFNRNGIRRGKNTLLGVAVGFSIVMAVCAVGSFELFQDLPRIMGILKVIGAAYIVWLAIHILRSKPNEATTDAKGDFWTALLLQFVNVKIILYAITIYSGYILPNSDSKVLLGVSAICNTLVGLSGCVTWALAGRLLQRQFAKHYRMMNTAMAAVLLWSAFHLLW
ncbi:LysE family transporter [Paenibacillus sp. sgz500958]|uniref:LysE family transporter n=1 Tax=Paenibacillus sp. sgz500958 TaxID=3242475 RepID=UPI0036D21B8B